MNSQLSQALESWTALLGTPCVVVGVDEINFYKLDTKPTIRDIPAVLRLQTRDQVIAVLKIASQYKIPVYPISKGNNWGYGSANPAKSGSVILDLSGMDQIRDYDKDFGVVTVEPGVTQKLLSDFLLSQGDEYIAPVTGAGPEASILGNALERGYGITPIADHFSAVISVEAVLADGTIYTSAFRENGCEMIDRIFKWGIGPYIDGIFSQGNFGIVTSITIQLAARPEKVSVFIFEMKDEKDLEKSVALVRETLRELGMITGSINLMNSLRLLSMNSRYPAEEIKKRPQDFVPMLEKMASDMDFAPWTCLGSFYGRREVVNAAIQLLKEKILPHSRRLIFLSRGQLNIIEKILSLFPRKIRERILPRIRSMKLSFDILEGRPNLVAMPLCYRKMPGGVPDKKDLNPAHDGCGIMWYAPLVPMRPDMVRRYVDFVHQVCVKHHIEPLITLTTVSDRCFDSTVPILFNSQNPIEVKQAEDCFQELLKTGQSLGFFPYRAGVDMMKDIVVPEHGFWATQKKIKLALDPQGIIAPGRYSYDFENRHSQSFPT